MNKKIVILWGLLIFLIGVSIITNEYYNSGNSEGPATKNEIIEEDKNNFELEPPKKAAGAPYNYLMTEGYPYTWIDATGGTKLLLSGDGYSTQSLPFNFQFYNETYSTIYLKT